MGEMVVAMGINVEVEYSIEPSQKETRMEPGWDARVNLESVVIGGEDFGSDLEKYFTPSFLYEIKEAILTLESDKHAQHIFDNMVTREDYGDG